MLKDTNMAQGEIIMLTK